MFTSCVKTTPCIPSTLAFGIYRGIIWPDKFVACGLSCCSISRWIVSYRFLLGGKQTRGLANKVAGEKQVYLMRNEKNLINRCNVSGFTHGAWVWLHTGWRDESLRGQTKERWQEKAYFSDHTLATGSFLWWRMSQPQTCDIERTNTSDALVNTWAGV